MVNAVEARALPSSPRTFDKDCLISIAALELVEGLIPAMTSKEPQEQNAVVAGE